MQSRDKEILQKLKRMRDDWGVIAVKAEFEAEGTRSDELLRLSELVFKSDLKLALKIGGCEAIRDLIDSKDFGADFIIAPMIETPYALSKFIQSIHRIYTDKHNECPKFLFNLETLTAYENKDLIFDLAKENKIDGCVFGRVDFARSIQADRLQANDKKITEFVKEVAILSKQNGLDFVMGGGISIEAIPILLEVASLHLSRFETRKLIFEKSVLDHPKFDQGLRFAVDFELSWLQHKKKHYEHIMHEDDKRIEMLAARLNM